LPEGRQGIDGLYLEWNLPRDLRDCGEEGRNVLVVGMID